MQDGILEYSSNFVVTIMQKARGVAITRLWWRRADGWYGRFLKVYDSAAPGTRLLHQPKRNRFLLWVAV